MKSIIVRGSSKSKIQEGLDPPGESGNLRSCVGVGAYDWVGDRHETEMRRGLLATGSNLTICTVGSDGRHPRIFGQGWKQSDFHFKILREQQSKIALLRARLRDKKTK